MLIDKAFLTQKLTAITTYGKVVEGDVCASTDMSREA